MGGAGEGGRLVLFNLGLHVWLLSTVFFWNWWLLMLLFFLFDLERVSRVGGLDIAVDLGLGGGKEENERGKS